jgi:O-antigen/teichoic acid export membrane protein
MSQVIDKAARGTVLHGVAQIALALAGYVVALILARGLGAADYGVYGQIYTFLMAIELITLWGVPGAVSRLTAEGRDADGRLRATGLGLVLLWCLLGFAVLWLGAGPLASWLGIGDHVAELRLAIIDVPCFGSYFLIAHVLNGRRDFIGQSTGVCLYALTKIVGTAALLWLGLTIRSALIINIASSLVGLLWVLFRAGFPGIALHRAQARTIVSLAGPMAVIALSAQLMLGMDQWLIGYFHAGVGQATGGYYIGAKNLARFPNLVAFVLNAVLIPSIAHAVGRGEHALVVRLVQGSVRFLLLTLVPACALVAAAAAPLLRLLFPADYAAGAPFLQWLVIGNGLLQTVCSTLITLLVATRNQKAGALVAALGVLPAVLLNVVLIPRLGAIGGAIAATGATAVAMTAAGLLVWRRVGPFVSVLEITRIAVAVAAVCLLARWLPSSPWLLLPGLALLAVLFYAFCWLLGALRREDITLLWSRLAGRNPKPAM